MDLNGEKMVKSTIFQRNMDFGGFHIHFIHQTWESHQLKICLHSRRFESSELRCHHHIEPQVELVSVQQQGAFLGFFTLRMLRTHTQITYGASACIWLYNNLKQTLCIGVPMPLLTRFNAMKSHAMRCNVGIYIEKH